MAYSPVDKFLHVAKILTDARLQELVEENRRLKLALFWKTYGVRQLRERIVAIQRRVKCKCKSCNSCGQSREFNGEWECAVTRRFEGIAREHGLSTAKDLSTAEDGTVMCYAVTNPELGDEMDDEVQFFFVGDVHIVLQSSVTLGWVVVGYGEKLSEAKFAEDPELIKLKKLFETLEDM